MKSDSAYIIAEAGVNHNGSLNRAIDMIEVAASAGVDAVKFQTFNADALATETAPKAEYQLNRGAGGDSQLKMLQGLQLSKEDHYKLVEKCSQEGVAFLSSPFDLESARFLIEELNLNCIKIGSGEITNGPLLYLIGSSGREIILSTGMSNYQDIENALGIIALGRSGLPIELDEAGYLSCHDTSELFSTLKDTVSLLHCTTAYPCPAEQVNLRVIPALSNQFQLPVGYSDHTQGIHIPLAAVALGACIIEKHFTLDHTLPGPDHAASIESDELKSMVSQIRELEIALGNGVKVPTEVEEVNATVARKSLVAARAIMEGELFSDNNLTAKRPEGGISPLRYWEYLGKAAQRDYKKDEMID